jgi:hypothetical protein
MPPDWEKTRFLIYRNEGSLEPFHSKSWISLESLQKAVFPFASSRALQYRIALHHRWACCFYDCVFL